MADMLGNLRTTAAVCTSRAGAEAHSRDSFSPLQPFMGAFNIVKTPPFWLATTTRRPFPPLGSRGVQGLFAMNLALSTRDGNPLTAPRFNAGFRRPPAVATPGG